MASVQAAVDGTVEKLGGIDIVLANAGIGTYGTAEKGDPEAWLRTIDINLNGAYRTLHATLPHVIERRGYIGVVCSIASFAPLAGMSSYNASKAGAEAWSAPSARRSGSAASTSEPSIRPGSTPIWSARARGTCRASRRRRRSCRGR